MNESEIKKCPKCRGEMIEGSQDNLEWRFACTRREPNPEAPQIAQIQSYYCKNCGYIEFYRKTREEGVKHE
jgi:predicted nucleic-acid-binding Zn-ribbon protein